MNFNEIRLMKNYVFCLFVILISAVSHGQDMLQGKIYSAKDSAVVVGASVYFDGTNLGVSSDLDGSFRIRKPEGAITTLIISSLGYETIAIPNLDNLNPRNLKIYLTESTESLGEVFLETDPWSRKKKLNIFRREFLGNSTEAGLCKIKNEEVLQLVYVPSKDILLAYADEPLQIVNRYLGYEVKYNLENFRVEFSTGNSGFRLTSLVYYEGYSFFEELKQKPRKKHLKNRSKTYYGSSLHFMRSLSAHQLAENNFRIFHNKFEVPPYQFFEVKAKNNLAQIEILTDELHILYKDIYQSVLVAEDSFYIDPWGNHTPPVNVIFGGEMSQTRLAKTLPLNYFPD